MTRRDEPLYRKTDDKILGGVCAGIAQYFDIDTTLVRVAFVVFAMIGGGGILGYLILWAVLQPAPKSPPPELEREPADDPVPEAALAGPDVKAGAERPEGQFSTSGSAASDQNEAPTAPGT